MTNSADKLITDSAAAVTAIVSGHKTNAGVLELDTSLVRVTSIAEIAKSAGYKIGIITSVSLDHATQAGFFAHQPSRSNCYQIGEELITSGFDFFGGGGLKGNTVSIRKEQADFFDRAKDAGYRVAGSVSDLNSLKAGQKVIAMGSQLDSDQALPYVMDSSGATITLADFTEHGVELLDNEK